MDVNFSNQTFTGVTNVSISETPVYIGGEYKYDRAEITIEGVVFGDSSSPRPDTLNSGYVTAMFPENIGGKSALTIAGTNYGDFYLKQVSTDQSDYDYATTYTATFVGSDELVTNEQNQWSFSEDNGIITGTHTVSATGVSSQGTSSVDAAKSHVESLLGVLPPPSVHFSAAATWHKFSFNEVYDRASGTCTITEEYKAYKTTARFASEAFIITSSLDIQYDRLSESLKANIQGELSQGVLGALPAQSDFDVDKAKGVLEEFINNSVNQTQEGYSLEALVDIGSTIETNEAAKTLKFNYNFEQVEAGLLINNNVKHDYNVSLSVSKEGSPYITATINGTLTYAKTDNPIDINVDIKDSARWLAIDAAWGTIDPRAVILPEYNSFQTAQAAEYQIDTGLSLRLEPESYSVTKDMESISLSYNYTYNDRFDWGAANDLTNLRFSVTDKKSIEQTSIKPTISGFASQVVGKKAGAVSVNGSCEDDYDEAKKDSLRGFCSSRAGDGVFVQDSSLSYDVKNMSYSITKLYIS